MTASDFVRVLREPRTTEWYTPPEIFDALGLEFDLDPCAPRGGVEWVPASRSLSIDENGLAAPWSGRVWLNPPYGRQLPLWIGRMLEHGDGVALVFARTDTRWAQAALIRADAVCFVAGRVNFIHHDPRFRGANGTTSNAGAPSLLFGFGEACAAAVRACGLGVVLP